MFANVNMDVIRGLFLVIGFLVLNKLNSLYTESKTFYCRYIDQLHYSVTLTRPETDVSGQCGCRRSFLTDRSRYRLFSFFDQYRSEIADGVCSYCRHHSLPKYSNLFRMNYHWNLEVLSLHLLTYMNNNGRFERNSTPDVLTEVADNLRSGFSEYKPQPDILEGSVFTLSMLYVAKNITVKHPQFDVITALLKHLADNEHTYFWKDNTNGTVSNHTLRKIMLPGNTYFGCGLRCCGRGPRDNLEHYFLCTFATSTTDANLREGQLSEQSCSESDPKGILTTTGDNLPICLASEYVTRHNHEMDWPCQFYYRIDDNIFNTAAMQICSNDRKHPEPGFASLVFPDRSFSKMRISYRENDTIFIENPLEKFSDPLCAEEFTGKWYIILKRLVYCSSSVLLFASAGGFLLISSAALILCHSRWFE